MTPEKKQKHYAIAQHALCCKYLDVAEPYDGDGDTLFEAVVALTKDRDEWKDATDCSPSSRITMKPYYYIFRVGGSHPRFKHPTLESAHTEAMRLAAQHPGDSFEILQCLATTRTVNPQTFWMDGVIPPNTQFAQPDDCRSQPTPHQS